MRGALAVVVLLAVIAAVWWFKFEHGRPEASLAQKVEVLGAKTPFDVDVHAGATGIRTVEVHLQSSGADFDLSTQTFPASSWRGSGLRDTRIHVEPDLRALKVPEGQGTLEVFVDTYAWHLWSPRRAPALSVPIAIDLTPPRLELLTSQHNVRLGGMELVLFRQSADTVRSGVQVAQYFFPSTKDYFADKSIALAFFAIPQDLTDAAKPLLVASDAAGNQSTAEIPVRIKNRRFAERTLSVDDDFLLRKVPEIEHASGITPEGDLVQRYVFINAQLRKKNEARIHEITSHSEPRPLWDGAFHRQSNAAPLSSFADRRTYTYGGQVIDHETHLGYDLASLKLAPVEAAQRGVVAFAGNLGIYGNAVILDHGLGVFSLYGHLSTISVKEGERVQTAQSLGQTGETGLAGGDHLHFSVLLYGTQVDPVEWWDPHWLHDHVDLKLAMFPKATQPPG